MCNFIVAVFIYFQTITLGGSGQNSDSKNVGLIVGLVVGLGVPLIIIIVLVIIYLVKKRSTTKPARKPVMRLAAGHGSGNLLAPHIKPRNLRSVRLPPIKHPPNKVSEMPSASVTLNTTTTTVSDTSFQAHPSKRGIPLPPDSSR